MDKPTINQPNLSQEKIIEVNLSKKFGSFTAVDNISFEVYKGEILVFLGQMSRKNNRHENAHRDSTPTSGEAVVAGYDVKSATEMVKKSIGYMSQKFSMYDDLTVKEITLLFRNLWFKPS
jgi:ABC-2 type transport system ATP-binding protein